MSKTQTMTPERETWEILTTFHRMTQDERDEACTRIARAFKAEAALPDLLAALRNLVASLDTGGANPWHDESPTHRNGRLDVDAGSAAMEHNEVLRAEIAAARAAIAKAEGGAA